MLDGFGWGGGQHRRLERRVARLERMLKALLEHLNVPYDDDEAQAARVSDRVRSLVRDGQLIEAIKQYREDTGVGLAEAKEVVDGLRRS